MCSFVVSVFSLGDVGVRSLFLLVFPEFVCGCRLFLFGVRSLFRLFFLHVEATDCFRTRFVDVRLLCSAVFLFAFSVFVRVFRLFFSHAAAVI